MRELAEVAPGVLMATSPLYCTTSTVVVGRDGACLVIDPALTAPELAGLAAAISGRGLGPQLGFSTHPHWDHMLWCAQLGNVPRYGAPAAVATAVRQHEQLVAELLAEAPGHDLDLFGLLVPLPEGVAALTWEGPQAQLITHNGHAPGHCAIFLVELGVLVAGDMCSDVEPPLLDLSGASPIGDYRSGLARLGELDVRLVIPGHGHVGDGVEYRRRLRADRDYLARLEQAEPFDDPRCVAGWLGREHQKQLSYARSLKGRT